MKKEPDFIHPALTQETKVINLRKVPTSTHRALTIAAMDAGESLEQFITNRLQTLIKGA